MTNLNREPDREQPVRQFLELIARLIAQQHICEAANSREERPDDASDLDSPGANGID